MIDRTSQLRAQILDLVGQYCAEQFAPKPFTPGESAVPVSGKVFDAAEMQSLVDSSLDFWLTTGRFADAVRTRVCALSRACANASLVNSGSSANLLALSALTSPKLGDRRLEPGDEVITVAAGFPTTVNPIVQNGLVPVFVDVAHAHLQRRRRRSSKQRSRPANARDHDRAHAGQSVRPGSGDGVRANATICG